jgi:hypothetical protein
MVVLGVAEHHLLRDDPSQHSRDSAVLVHRATPYEAGLIDGQLKIEAHTDIDLRLTVRVISGFRVAGAWVHVLNRSAEIQWFHPNNLRQS